MKTTYEGQVVEEMRQRIESLEAQLATARQQKESLRDRVIELEAPERQADLARLKARWQAEALREASDEFEFHERARQVLKWKADKIEAGGQLS